MRKEEAIEIAKNEAKSLSQKSNSCKIKGLEESASKVRYVIENK